MTEANNKQQIGKYKKNFFFSILLFRITLDIVYAKVITNGYWASHFSYKPDFGRYVLSYSFLIITIFLVNLIVTSKSTSSILFLCIYLVAYVPNGALYSGMSLEHYYFIYSNIYWFCMIVFYSIINLIKFKINLCQFGKLMTKITKVIPYIIALVIILFAWKYNGLSLTISLKDDYELRLASRLYEGNAFLLNRLLPWAAIVFFPISFIYSFKHRKLISMCLFVFSIVVAFSINGMKSWIFILGISFLVSLLVKKDSTLLYIPVGLFGLNIISIFSYTLFNNIEISNYIARKVLFSASLNNYYHVSYFMGHTKMYMTQSILGWIRKFGINIPYTDSISRLIGAIYYNADTNAPAGTFADAYENFGIIGLALYPLITVIFIKLLDAVSKNIPLVYTVPVIATFAYYLLNGNIFSALWSYGYLIGICYIYLLNRSGILTEFNNRRHLYEIKTDN